MQWPTPKVSSLKPAGHLNLYNALADTFTGFSPNYPAHDLPPSLLAISPLRQPSAATPHRRQLSPRLSPDRRAPRSEQLDRPAAVGLRDRPHRLPVPPPSRALADRRIRRSSRAPKQATQAFPPTSGSRARRGMWPGWYRRCAAAEWAGCGGRGGVHRRGGDSNDDFAGDARFQQLNKRAKLRTNAAADSPNA